MFATGGSRDLEIVRTGLPSHHFPTLSTRFFQLGVAAISEKMEYHCAQDWMALALA
jgi:hypothetical protein